MNYIEATEEYIEEVYKLVQETILTIYPRYYPKEVVDFFCMLHNKEKIAEDIKQGHLGILLDNDNLVGTGSYKGNHITRVYVKPAVQGKGYGSYIMQCLEDKIGREYDTVYLDASLPAVRLYERRGYRTKSHEKWDLENNVVLVYEVMKLAMHQ